MMPAPALNFQFDVDKLLSPITTDRPAGADLRYEPVYDQIRELRREDDATLPQGVWKSDQKRAEWKAVEALCLETLETRSKDLQIAAWLLEAWVHLHGFEGAAEGFRLMHALCDGFWDDLYPRIEGGDIEFRIGPLVWLNSKLATDFKLLPLTAPEAEGVPVCTLADWEIAAHTASQQSRAPQQPVAGRAAVTMASFQQSMMLTPSGHFVAVAARIRSMVRQCAALERLLDQKLGRESPGLSIIRGTGESALALLDAFLRERNDYDPAPGEDLLQTNEPGSEPEESGEENGYWHPGGHIRSRSEAYRYLAEAADFLARTEPHSPTSYLVRRAIAWGSMPLQDLLPELVRNPGELAEIYRLLNVRPSEGNKK
jgi:type VI secretion system ImpA family protein